MKLNMQSNIYYKNKALFLNSRILTQLQQLQPILE